jgi:uncharacterized protein YkwD
MISKPMARSSALSLSLILSLSLVACGGGGGGTPSPDTVITPKAAILTVVAPSHSVTIPSSTYPADSVEQGAWRILQEGRTLCGFGKLTQDPNLDKAAANHSRYLNSISVASGTSVLSHEELITTNPFYKGFDPWDRTVAIGQNYGDQVAEILEATVWDYDSRNPPAFPTAEQRGANSMRSLMNTVYHLVGAMYHGPDVGLGADIQDVSTGGTARREEYRFGSLNGFQNSSIMLGRNVLATYPCDGSANIPTAFFPASENPNPFPYITDTKISVGPPIYLKVDEGQTLTLTSSSVVSQYGTRVPTTVLTARVPKPDPYIGDNEVFVVPTTALQSNTSYEVNLGVKITLNGQLNGFEFTRRFTMITEP